MTTDMGFGDGELYDLEENLVLSCNGIGASRFTDIYEKNAIEAITAPEGGQPVSYVILDASGNIIITYGLNHSDIVSKEADLEKNIITVQSNSGQYHEYNLTTGEETVIELETGTKRIHEILVKKSGDFYQLYIEDD